jgi:hypothetical protein
MSSPEKQLHIDIPENDNLNVIVPASLRAALDVEAARTGEDTSAIIIAALAQYLGTPIHTLFQVSTSGALVALALPENEAFLRADLSKNAADELAYAEQAH